MLLAWSNVYADLEDGDGDGERALKYSFISSPVSSSVGDPGSMAVVYDSHDSRSFLRSCRDGLAGLLASVNMSVLFTLHVPYFC